MKNQKLTRLQGLFVLIAVIVLSSCMNNRAAETEKTAVLKDNQRVEKKADRNDANFLVNAAKFHREEISLGKLAQRKSKVDHVKEHGKMMENDHSKSLEELKSLALSKNISIPNSPSDSDSGDYRTLTELDSISFGREYSEMMVEKHQNAIDLFEEAIEDTNDPQIKAWATKTQAVLKTHLSHSLACRKECTKS